MLYSATAKGGTVVVGDGKVPVPHLKKVYGRSLMAEVLQQTVKETSSQAIAVRLLGNDISGGESSGDGAHGGALLAVPANPLLALAIADWRAENSTSPSTSARLPTSCSPISAMPRIAARSFTT